MCEEANGKLPTEQQLADMANALFPGINASANDGWEENKFATGPIGSGSTPLPEALSGLGTSYMELYSNRKHYGRAFVSLSGTKLTTIITPTSGTKAICVTD